MLKYIIVLLLLSNAVSFFIVAWPRKGMANKGFRRTGENSTTTYLVSGILSDSDEPFDWLLGKNCPIKGGIHIVTYRNFGFNPHTAAFQLGCDVFQNRRSAIFVTMSIGALVPSNIDLQLWHVAIDPCFGRQSRNKLNHPLSHVVSILFEIITFLLGWLAFIPVFKRGKKRYSLALLADWFYWATKDSELEDDTIMLDGLITSTYDENINNAWVDEHIRTYKAECRKEIPFRHADIKKIGAVYATDLSSILRQFTDFRIFGL